MNKYHIDQELFVIEPFFGMRYENISLDDLFEEFQDREEKLRVEKFLIGSIRKSYGGEIEYVLEFDNNDGIDNDEIDDYEDVEESFIIPENFIFVSMEEAVNSLNECSNTLSFSVKQIEIQKFKRQKEEVANFERENNIIL